MDTTAIGWLCEAGDHAGLAVGSGCLGCNCSCHGRRDPIHVIRLTPADSAIFLAPSSRRDITIIARQAVLDGARKLARMHADSLGRTVEIMTNPGAWGCGLLVDVIRPPPPKWGHLASR